MSFCGLVIGVILFCFCCMTDWEDGGWAVLCGFVWELFCCWLGGFWGSCFALVLGGVCVICFLEKFELKVWLWGVWEFGICFGGCLLFGFVLNSMDIIKYRDVRGFNLIFIFIYLWNIIWEFEIYLGVFVFEVFVFFLLLFLCYLGWVGFWIVVCMLLFEFLVEIVVVDWR